MVLWKKVNFLRCLMFYEKRDSLMRLSKGSRLCDICSIHMHYDIEVVFCITGNFKCVINDEVTDVHPGEFCIVFPNQSHYYITDDTPLSFYLLIFNPELVPEFRNHFIAKKPLSPVSTVNDYNYSREIFEKAVELNKVEDCFSTARQHGFLKLICTDLMESLKFVKTDSKSNTTILADLINYCNQNYKNEIKLNDLEINLHASKYYISHIFKDKLNTTFSEYIHSLRIKDSCHLLESTNENITTIAYSVGYNTVRSFNRIFLKHMGLTPTEYRNIHLINAKTSG